MGDVTPCAIVGRVPGPALHLEESLDETMLHGCRHCCCVLVGPVVQAATFTLEKDAEGVNVLCDGKLFTRYIMKSGAKPVLWPIVGPTGQEMTRGYPMREPRGPEKRDHIHHRSLWFDHGDVNGISFWDEAPEGHGRIDHVEYLTLAEGEQAVIRTRNDVEGTR